MLSYQVYKLVHFLGIFLVLMSLGGMVFASMQQKVMEHPWRKKAAMFHGIGLFLVLLGGFGMLARLGIITGLPGWVYGKLFIWLLLGAALFFAKRYFNLAKLVWWGSVGAALVAGYLALYKPF